MKSEVSVAEKLRNAADLCSGQPSAVLMRKEYLLELADELDPNPTQVDPAVHAVAARTGFESIGYVDLYGHRHFYFISRRDADQGAWEIAYERAFRDSRFAVPALK